MGILDFGHEKEHYRHIKRVLARRGMKIDKKEEWEVHGPHQDMNYYVYVGYGYFAPEPGARCICSSKTIIRLGCRAHKRYCCVAIYPKSVYEIEDTSEWWKTNPESRIFVE